MEGRKKSLQTVILDDEWSALNLYMSLLQRHDYTSVLGAFLNADTLVYWLENTTIVQPDVVLIDVEYRHAEWPLEKLIRHIIDLVPGCEVLCLSQYGDALEANIALEAGAHGLLHKSDVGYGLASAVWMTMKVDFLYSHGVESVIQAHFPALYRREYQMPSWIAPAYLSKSLEEAAIGLYLEGKSAAAVSDEMQVTRATVNTYGKRVRPKVEDAWHLSYYNAAMMPSFEHLRTIDPRAWLFHVLSSLPGSNWPREMM